MKLISMTEFVENAWAWAMNSKDQCEHNTLQLNAIHNYSKFLKQTLKLEMFVPCDEEGNFLKEINICDNCNSCEDGEEECRLEYIKYQKAKEKVIFEGFKLTSINKLEVYNKKLDCGYGFNYMSGGTVESFCRYGVTLTPSAIKQIGL